MKTLLVQTVDQWRARLDEHVRRLNDRQYAIKFTPRRPNSRWSDVNRMRYAELAAEGRLKPADIERCPSDRGSAPGPPRLSLPAKLPAYFQTALKNHPKAKRQFDALTPPTGGATSRGSNPRKARGNEAETTE